MITIHKPIEIKFEIVGFETYGQADDGKVYNIKTSREIHSVLNNGSIGFWFGRKFRTASKIRKRLIKDDCPF
jgi:hypothetical protein